MGFLTLTSYPNFLSSIGFLFFYVWGSTARGSSTNNIIINMTVSNDTVPIDGPKSDE